MSAVVDKRLAAVFYRRRAHARARGLEFMWDNWRDMYDDLGRPEGTDCPCCGTTMTSGGSMETSPSIDRLVPADGYTKENCWIVCVKCNNRMNDSTPEQMYAVADAFYKERKRRGLDGRGK